MGDAADERDKLDEGASFPIVGVGASAGGLGGVYAVAQGSAVRHRHGICAVPHLDPEHESVLRLFSA